MGARSKARKRALDVLYEAAARSEDPLEVLRARTGRQDPPVPGYAAELVEGVQAHREQIDGLLAAHAVEWTLERMPPVDLAALRIGVFELLWCPDVPDAVAVDEAVELAASLSTPSSAGFVNGLLARILELKPGLDLGQSVAGSAESTPHETSSSVSALGEES